MIDAGTLAAGVLPVAPGMIANVVTHLEVLARPPALPEPAGLDLRLVALSAPDPARYRALLRRVGTPWLWHAGLERCDESLCALMSDPLTPVHALVHRGQDAGILELDFTASGSCEIVYLGVEPGLTGSGAGRWLMNHAFELAFARPVGRVWLHTCTLDHPAALRFYQRAGLRAFRREVEIEPDPRLTGTLPRDAAPDIPLIEP